MKHGGLTHQFWLKWIEFGIIIQIWGIDTKPSKEIEIRLPYFPWRLLCFFKGHEPWEGNECILCHKDLRASGKS